MSAQTFWVIRYDHADYGQGVERPLYPTLAQAREAMRQVWVEGGTPTLHYEDDGLEVWEDEFGNVEALHRVELGS